MSCSLAQGKTSFMRSFRWRPPIRPTVHPCARGRTTWRVLRALPQVGTVVMPDEQGYEERLSNSCVNWRRVETAQTAL
ncbi:MAG: hypothetical protein R3E79_04110 [Caldilineaceae bacterium]